jgi:hypothetical protein
MTTAPRQKTSVTIKKFLDSFDAPAQQKLTLAACTLELFRQSQMPAKNPAFLKALGQFAQAAGSTNWGALPFSITQATLGRGKQVAAQYGAKPEQVDAVLLEALAVFSDMIGDGLMSQDINPADLFDAVIAEIAELAQNKSFYAEPVVAPEVYNERMLARVFKPAAFGFTDTFAAELEASLVVFRDALPNGDMGPSLRGIAFDNGTNTWHIILESGEFVTRAKDDESVRVTNTAEDYAEVCPALLAFCGAAAKDLKILAVLNDAKAAALTAAATVAFSRQLMLVSAQRSAVASLETVIDAATEAANLGVTGATGPHGASVRIAVPGTEFVVVLDALTAVTGSYVVARLMYDDNVVMRLEYPRQFSARGVYLFPLPQCAVVLNILD